MKIFRSVGPFSPVVGALCVFLIVPVARVDAQSAELSGAVKAVRQAEKQADNRDLKVSLGEASKALKRAEKLAAKEQMGPLLDEISVVRKHLVSLLDESQVTASPATPEIERAVGLIDGAIRAAGGFRTVTDTSLGLHTTTLASLRGTVRVYLPEDIRVGDTISGAVEVDPAGATPEERRRNGAALSGVVIAIEDHENPASDGSVYWRVPTIDYGTPATLILRDASGAEVGRTTVPINPVPDGLGPADQPLPGDYEIPPIVQFGNPFTIAGPFDGEFATTALDLGGELTMLAESPRTVVARAPLDLVGRHPMTVSEGETIITREVNVIQLHLSAGKLDLLKGETTVVTAEVTGFAELEPEAYPIEFEMINHSPETVTMEGLEDNRFYKLIFPEDISTAEDLAAVGAFVVESTLVGIRTGTFDISATVTSPILFDVLGPGQAQLCSEEKRFRLLCVRFIVLDEPGAKDRTKDPKGLLTGVTYNGKNIGEVSPAAVAKVRAALEKANAVWLQCFAHCCWIHFYLHTDNGKPAVYALDPKGNPVVYERDRRIVDGPNRGKVKVKTKIDLTQFLDKQNSRGITMKDGGADGTIDKEVTWDQDVGTGIKQGDSARSAATQAARDAAEKLQAEEDKLLTEEDAQQREQHQRRKEDLQRRKEYYERMAETSRKATLNVLETFGDLIDQELGEECINIIIVSSLTDTGGTGDESGFATLGGRNIFLEEGELDSASGAVLAHELGHNLGLDHVNDASRLMNEGSAGTTLTKDECEKACDTAITDRDLKPVTQPEDEAKKRFDALEKAREEEAARKAKEEEERKKKEEEEGKKKEEAERQQQELEKIDERLDEIDRRMAELDQKIEEKEKGFRETVKNMKRQSEAEKKKILDDNLPSWAKEEKAELEELKKEKAGLEEKKAGLQK